MSDLVVRLLAAIDEREQKARDAGAGDWDVQHHGRVSEEGDIIACEPGCECRVVEGADVLIYDEGGHDEFQAAHIAVNDPASVLRLCQSHRDIVAEWRKQKQIGDQIEAEESGSDTHFTSVGVVAGLWAAVILVARGCGIEEEATDDE